MCNLFYSWLIYCIFVEVLKNHVLPNVICSAVIQGTKYSINLLNKNLRLERDEDDKLFVEGVQIIDIDVMGTNGVLYLIDEVLLSDDGTFGAIFSGHFILYAN